MSGEEEFDALDYVKAHLSRAFKEKVADISEKAVLQCYCTRYRQKLVFVGNKVFVRVFKTPDGKEHPCFKLKNGQWAKCGRLRLG